jgi:hypothetical protein
MLFRKAKNPSGSDAAAGTRVSGSDPVRLDAARIAAVAAAARWRSPGSDLRREAELERAILVLERTAACADLALDRLGEVAASLETGRREQTYLMRGLMTGRVEELLDSLAGLARMSVQDGVNLLGPGRTGLRVQHEGGDFNYSLPPVCIHRGPEGLAIPLLHSAFEDDAETDRVTAAVARARRRLSVFAQRLAADAEVIIAMVEDLRQKRAELEAVERARTAAAGPGSTAADPTVAPAVAA